MAGRLIKPGFCARLESCVRGIVSVRVRPPAPPISLLSEGIRKEKGRKKEVIGRKRDVERISAVTFRSRWKKAHEVRFKARQFKDERHNEKKRFDFRS